MGINMMGQKGVSMGEYLSDVNKHDGALKVKTKDRALNVWKKKKKKD